MTPDDYRDSYPVILLDLHYAGQTYRVASEPCEVITQAGDSLSYAGGLDPVSVSETLGRLTVDTSSPTASIRCVLPIDVAAFVRAGHTLTRATADLWMAPVEAHAARLSVPVATTTAEDRWPLLSGVVRRPVYAVPGAPAGAIEFTLSSAPWATSPPIVPPAARITTATISNVSREAIGKRYPTVRGAPGRLPDGTGVAGSPAYCIKRTGADADLLLIAGHPVPDAAVTVVDEDGDTYFTSPVTTRDAYGRTYAYVDVSAGTATTPAFSQKGQQYWIGWHLSDASSGDVIDVLVWALQLTGETVDVPAWEAIRGRVPALQVATYISDDVRAWEWVQRHILPMLPVSVRRGPAGLRPVIYDTDLRASAAVAHVEASSTPAYGGSGDWVAVSGIAEQTDIEDMPAATVVRYAMDGQRNGPLSSVSIDAQSGTWYTRAAAMRQGVDLSGYAFSPGATTVTVGGGAPQTQAGDGAVELELPAVWDAATAAAIGLWRARAYSQSLSTRTYEAPWLWGWVQVGDTITITDPAVGWTRQVVAVNARAWGEGRWLFEVLIDSDAIRDGRTVS